MKIAQIEVPDGYAAKWIDGVLRLVEESAKTKQANFGTHKYNVNDTVRIVCLNQVGRIIDKFESNGEPGYKIYVPGINYLQHIPEDDLELCEPKVEQKAKTGRSHVSEDICDRIKTFEDACEWCNENNYIGLVSSYFAIIIDCKKAGGLPKDVLAYLKLRIITAALNEGWEPSFKECEMMCYVEYDCINNICEADYYTDWATSSVKLAFKSVELAEYAATQFRDIYADFCGSKKGGEK